MEIHSPPHYPATRDSSRAARACPCRKTRWWRQRSVLEEKLVRPENDAGGSVACTCRNHRVSKRLCFVLVVVGVLSCAGVVLAGVCGAGLCYRTRYLPRALAAVGQLVPAGARAVIDAAVPPGLARLGAYIQSAAFTAVVNYTRSSEPGCPALGGRSLGLQGYADGGTDDCHWLAEDLLSDGAACVMFCSALNDSLIETVLGAVWEGMTSTVGGLPLLAALDNATSPVHNSTFLGLPDLNDHADRSACVSVLSNLLPQDEGGYVIANFPNSTLASEARRAARASSPRKVVVMFVNGIRTKKEGGEDSANELQRFLDKRMTGNYLVSYGRNPIGRGFWEDITETFQMVQSRGSNEFYDTLTHFFLNDLASSFGDKLVDESKKYPFPDGWCSGTFPQYKDKVASALVQMIKLFTSSGYPVLMVAHSQGNFFANLVVSKLRTEPYARHVSLIGVASPASYVGVAGRTSSSTYITRRDDVIINTFRGMLQEKQQCVPSLVANDEQCTGSNTDGALHHSFQVAYLASRKNSAPTSRARCVANLLWDRVRSETTSLRASFDGAPPQQPDASSGWIKKLSSNGENKNKWVVLVERAPSGGLTTQSVSKMRPCLRGGVDQLEEGEFYCARFAIIDKPAIVIAGNNARLCDDDSNIGTIVVRLIIRNVRVRKRLVSHSWVPGDVNNVEIMCD